MPVQYPIRAVSKLTGLAIDTLRAWERRYQAVTPTMSKRGRLYDEAHVRRLVLLRRAVESGHAIGQVAPLNDAELEGLQRAASSAQTPRNGLDGALSLALQPLLKAIQAYDYSATNEELGRLALLLSPSDLVHKAILPLMRMAGEKWVEGSFQIAHEHLLSACVRNLLGGMVRRHETPPGAPGLLLTTPSGELHEFGILAAALLGVAHHFQVSYLGPNLPAGEIRFAAQSLGPRAVVLGIMETNVTPAVRADVAALARELPPAVELWIGGSGRAAVVDAASAVLLEDLSDFERHLARLQSSRPKEVVR